MRFFLDEDVPVEIGRVLVQAGHEVVFSRDAMVCSAADCEVFEFAAARSFILVTCNRDDFLPLATGQRHAGLIVVIRRKTRIAECAKVIRLLAAAGEIGLSGNINFA